jgi:hypothetical protein
MYDMVDFALAGFAPFFMQSPSFLAHQRHLETGQGRSNCQTLFGLRKIPGDGQIRTKSKVRAKVEHYFWLMKRVFGFTVVRYKGLEKNAHRLFVTCALINLCLVRRRLLRA